MRVAAVEQYVRVVAWPVTRLRLQEGAELRAQHVPCHAAAGVITAMGIHHVVREKALHVVQHACGAQVQLLHLVRGQQGGLFIHTGTEGNIKKFSLIFLFLLKLRQLSNLLHKNAIKCIYSVF